MAASLLVGSRRRAASSRCLCRHPRQHLPGTDTVGQVVRQLSWVIILRLSASTAVGAINSREYGRAPLASGSSVSIDVFCFLQTSDYAEKSVVICIQNTSTLNLVQGHGVIVFYSNLR